MSPILVRPVREQLEHDRIIRQLQAKFKRKFDALINPGNEQNAPVAAGTQSVFPDVVLLSLERGRKLMGVIEVQQVHTCANCCAILCQRRGYRSRGASSSRAAAVKPRVRWPPVSMIGRRMRLPTSTGHS